GRGARSLAGTAGSRWSEFPSYSSPGVNEAASTILSAGHGPFTTLSGKGGRWFKETGRGQLRSRATPHQGAVFRPAAGPVPLPSTDRFPWRARSIHTLSHRDEAREEGDPEGRGTACAQRPDLDARALSPLVLHSWVPPAHFRSPGQRSGSSLKPEWPGYLIPQGVPRPPFPFRQYSLPSSAATRTSGRPSPSRSARTGSPTRRPSATDQRSRGLPSRSPR